MKQNNKKQQVEISVIIEALSVHHLTIKNAYKQQYNEKVNNQLIDLLDYVDLDTMECEKQGAIYNRGVIGENIVKYHILNSLDKAFNGCKSITNTCDIDLRKCDIQALEEIGLKRSTYEIKTLTKVANAHASQHNNKNYIILDLKYSNSVMLVDSKDLVNDNSGHVTGYTKGVKLDLLSELVGL